MTGSVLTKSTEENHTYAGVPAKDVTDKLHFWKELSHEEKVLMIQKYPSYYIGRLASKFVKVYLQGTGGDELYGGYP